jgi:hypothetical protein
MARNLHSHTCRILVAIAAPALTGSAFAWGNEGHEIVATIAQHYLTAKTAAAVSALLAHDASKLTAHTIAAEATWADAWRASSTAAYNETHNWHFADIEVPGGTLKAACFDFPALPAGTAASAGPPNDCHVDKIGEDRAELGPASTATVAEQVLALKFLLHFVGDEHQPLHSADAMDAGGNNKKVSSSKLGSGNLHAFWDTQFVASYGTSYATVATKLEAAITKADFTAWYAGAPADWANDANTFAVSTAYGMLPKPDSSGVYVLPATYVTAAEEVVGVQLEKAGVRLAFVLNQVFDPSGTVSNIPTRTKAKKPTHNFVPSEAFSTRDQRYHDVPGQGPGDR